MRTATGAAIEAFRNVLRAERIVRDREEELAELVARLDAIELAEYVSTTSDIEEGVERVRAEAEVAGWAFSTTRQRIAQAINHGRALRLV